MIKKQTSGGKLNLAVWIVIQAAAFFGPMVLYLGYDGDIYKALLLGLAALLLLWITVILISLLRNPADNSGSVTSDCSKWSVQWKSFKHWFWYEKWKQPWE